MVGVTTPLALGPVDVNTVAYDQAEVECTINKPTDGAAIYWGTSDAGETSIGWNGGVIPLGAKAAGIVPGTISALGEDTTYFFRFFGSITSPAEDAWSPAGTFSTGLGNEPAPADLTVDLVDGTTVHLSWSDGYATETGFVLHRVDDDAFTTNLQACNTAVDTTNHVDSSGDPFTTYWYRVV